MQLEKELHCWATSPSSIHSDVSSCRRLDPFMYLFSSSELISDSQLNDWIAPLCFVIFVAPLMLFRGCEGL